MKTEQIIDYFIDFEKITHIQPVRFTPDVVLTLLTIDGMKYVINETDYFDEKHEADGIKKVFNLRVVKWIKPRKKGDVEYYAPAVNIKNKVYGLAIVE